MPTSTPKFDLTFDDDSQKQTALNALRQQLTNRIEIYTQLWGSVNAPVAGSTGNVSLLTPGGQQVVHNPGEDQQQALAQAKTSVEALQAAISSLVNPPASS